MSKKRKYRKWVTCWLTYGVDPDGKGFVRLSTRGKPVCEIAVINRGNAAVKWWDAEMQARKWARRHKFELIKERL